ncbi:MAG: F0F1 ATP synthase subunit B [Sarcina sp.]
MSINWLTILATIINFIILVVIMKYLFWGKIKAIIETRQNLFLNKLSKADADIEEARKLRLEYEEMLKSAKEEGNKIVAEKKIEAEELYREILAKATNDSEILLDRTEKEIAAAKENALVELKAKTVDIAIMMSQKVLERSVDEDTHRDLINDYIDKVGI